MKRKIVGIFVCVLLAVTILPTNVTANETFGETITVDDDGGADFTRIQDAIDNASDGDTIFVFSGTYYENLNVESVRVFTFFRVIFTKMVFYPRKIPDFSATNRHPNNLALFLGQAL